MPAPVLVTPPATLPLSVDEAKAYARIDTAAEDDLILDLIRGAVDRLDGWTGLLGRALEAQTWEIEVGSLTAAELKLPLGPVAGIIGVYVTDLAGTEVTIDPEQYRLERDGIEGRLVLDFDLPAGALRVRWTAGVGCPSALKDVIRRMVRHEYDHREAMDDDALAAQIAPWRRHRI